MLTIINLISNTLDMLVVVSKPKNHKKALLLEVGIVVLVDDAATTVGFITIAAAEGRPVDLLVLVEPDHHVHPGGWRWGFLPRHPGQRGRQTLSAPEELATLPTAV